MSSSSTKSVAPLRLTLEPSRSLSLAIAAVHGLAGIAALANSLPWWIRTGLLGAVGVSFHLTLRNEILDPRVRELFLRPDGRWTILHRSGPPVTASLTEDTVVTRWIVILRLNGDAGKFAIPICRDSVDAESFRRLRVHLRVARSSHD